MSFTGNDQHSVLSIPTVHEPSCPDSLDLLYSVTVMRYKDGHACARLAHMDMRTHRLISEQMGCYTTLSGSRIAALQTLAAALTQAMVEERQASE